MLRTFLRWQVFCAAALLAAPAGAAEKVTLGAVGAASAAPWALYIAMDEGFFKAAGIDIDLVYGPSVASLLQQLTGGSLDIAASQSLADPVHADEHGANLGIVMIEGQVPPYALLANSKITTIEDLKSKIVSLDEPTGITVTYLDRMLGPHGMSHGDVDLIYQGATSARYAALESGAAQAAMLNPPASFAAMHKGYTNLGYVRTYARDLPFTGTIVANTWARAHKPVVQGFIAAYQKGVDWFYDTKNRDQAMQDLVKHTKQAPEMVSETYDFFQKIEFLEKGGQVSLRTLGNVVRALQAQHGVAPDFDVHRLVLPDVVPLAPE
jgi:ABC-type nitrate/sulfonate/bicarbonate transport system substrate-binding protein